MTAQSPKKRFFGTDGIRGRVNKAPMTTAVVHAVGAALVTRLQSQGKQSPTIVIGQDTRRSCAVLEAAFAAGACAMGADVVRLGVLPTPGVALLVQKLNADAGLMLSASHNPFHDNGLKLFDANGRKLPDAVELELEADIERGLRGDFSWPDGELVGSVRDYSDAVNDYRQHLISLWTASQDLKGTKIVLDCAQGAAYEVAPGLFEALGAQVHAIGIEPNGRNINANSGALAPERLQAQVLEQKANIGIALDGDADRLIVVDEKGEVQDGDAIMAICAASMFEEGKLPGGIVVATVMSNLGLEHALQARGMRLERTPVGDRYVKERMNECGATLGGEQSGHLIFSEYGTTGDGLLASLQLLRVMNLRGKPLSELGNIVSRVPQVLHNVRIREKAPWREIPAIAAKVEEVESQLGEQGRVLVRYSGTENKARVMVEGPDPAQIDGMAREIVAAFVEALGEHTNA